MTQRIYELFEQTLKEFKQEHKYATYIVPDPIKEKFAELIVRECSRVIVNGGYWSGGPIGPKRQCTPPEIAQMIKEHFGVEE